MSVTANDPSEPVAGGLISLRPGGHRLVRIGRTRDGWAETPSAWRGFASRVVEARHRMMCRDQRGLSEIFGPFPVPPPRDKRERTTIRDRREEATGTKYIHPIARFPSNIVIGGQSILLTTLTPEASQRRKNSSSTAGSTAESAMKMGSVVGVPVRNLAYRRAVRNARPRAVADIGRELKLPSDS